MIKFKQLDSRLLLRARLIVLLVLLILYALYTIGITQNSVQQVQIEYASKINRLGRMAAQVSRINNELEIINNQQQQYLLYELSGNKPPYRLKINFERADSEFSIFKGISTEYNDTQFYTNSHSIFLQIKAVHARIAEEIFRDQISTAIVISKNELTPLVEQFNRLVTSYLNTIEKQLSSSYSTLNTYLDTRLYHALVVTILFIGLLLYILLKLRSDLHEGFQKVRKHLTSLAEGNPTKNKLENESNEFGTIIHAINSLNLYFNKVESYLKSVNNSPTPPAALVARSANDTLANNLHQIAHHRQELETEVEKLRAQASQREWVFKGLSSFNNILTQLAPNVEELASNILQSLISYLEIPQAGFYVIQDDQDENYLQMIANYAYDQRRMSNQRIKIGEGLLGASVIEKTISYHQNLPDDFFRITSGIGHANAKYLLLIPLIHNDLVVGVIEIASLKEISAVAIEFLKQISPSIAVAVSTVRENQKNIQILKQAREEIEESHSAYDKISMVLEMTKLELQEITNTEEEVSRKIRAIDAHIAIAELTQTGEVLSINHAFEEITGFPISTIRRSKLTQIIRNPESIKLLRNGEPAHSSENEEIEIITNSGESRWLLGYIVWSTIFQNRAFFIAVDISRLHQKADKLQQFATTLKDKTDSLSLKLKTAEVEATALRSSRQTNNNIADIVHRHYAMGKFNADWQLEDCNEQLHELLKTENLVAKKMSLHSLFDESHKEKLTILSRSLLLGNIHRENHKIKLPNHDEECWVRISYKAIIDPQHKNHIFLLIFEDIQIIVKNETILVSQSIQIEKQAQTIEQLRQSLAQKQQTQDNTHGQKLKEELSAVYEILNQKEIEISEKNRTINQFATQIQQNKTQIQTLNQEKNIHQQRIESLREENKQQEHNTHNLQKEINQAQNEINTLRNKIEETQRALIRYTSDNEITPKTQDPTKQFDWLETLKNKLSDENKKNG